MRSKFHKCNFSLDFLGVDFPLDLFSFNATDDVYYIINHLLIYNHGIIMNKE